MGQALDLANLSGGGGKLTGGHSEDTPSGIRSLQIGRRTFEGRGGLKNLEVGIKRNFLLENSTESLGYTHTPPDWGAEKT